MIDRAYVDGKTLYELDQMGIRFVVIAKHKMAAYITALAKSVESPLVYERIETITHGQGRNQEAERLLTCVELATDIRTWESYRPPAQPGKHLRHEARPALNAVLVRMWRNHEQQNGPRIYLTNNPVDDPWTIVDLYDDRSWIENGLFRNSKQFFTLTRWFPKRSAAGVRSHLTFVVLMMATATAYRLWDKAQANPQLVPATSAKTTVTHRIVKAVKSCPTPVPWCVRLAISPHHPCSLAATSHLHQGQTTPTRSFLTTCSTVKVHSAGAASCSKKIAISSSSSLLTTMPSSTPTSSWSSPACLCPAARPNSAHVRTSCVLMVACHNPRDLQTQLQMGLLPAIPYTVTPDWGGGSRFCRLSCRVQCARLRAPCAPGAPAAFSPTQAAVRPLRRWACGLDEGFVPALPIS